MTMHQTIGLVPEVGLRLATFADRPALEAIKLRSIQRLLDPFLTEGQRVTVREMTPFDPRLIEDRTYYVATLDGRVVASGGWSCRNANIATATGGGSDKVVDPATGAARIRALYVDPDFARRGLGGMLLSVAQSAARLAGYRHAELIATMTGEELYIGHGWKVAERLRLSPPGREGVQVSLMRRRLER